jgi:tetratricopeptide (TPR) repeat protein
VSRKPGAIHILAQRVEVHLPVTLLDGAVATAQALFERHDYDQAAKILQTIVASKRRRDAIRLLAQVEARRNHLDRARVLAQEALEQNPRDVALLIDLARTALTQFQDEFIASDLLALAERTRINQADVLVMKGRMLLRKGRLDEAEATFDKAKQATERNAWPFYYLGDICQRQGRLDEATEVLLEGEEFYFNNNCSGGALHAIRTKLAYAYVMSNEMELAKPIVESLVEQNPERPEVVRLYALYSIKKDGVKEAAKALERLRKAPIRNREDRCQFHLLYGLFFLGIGEVDRAGH